MKIYGIHLLRYLPHLRFLQLPAILAFVTPVKCALLILFVLCSSFGVGEDAAKSDSDSEEEEEGEVGLLANEDDLNKEIKAPSRSRQMNAGNLDAKIVKALKKQEEKREKRVTRKKEVCFLIL